MDINAGDNADIKKISNKIISKKIVLLFFSLLVSMFAIFTFLIPEYEQMKIMKMKTAVIENNLESKKDILEKITNFSKTYKSIGDENFEKINSLLPSENNFEEHLANIDKLAKAKGVLIENFSVSKIKSGKLNTANDDKFKSAQITFSLTGGFSKIMSFLDSLEKSIPLANLNSLKIKGSEEVGEDSEIKSGNVNCDIDFSFYHL